MSEVTILIPETTILKIQDPKTGKEVISMEAAALSSILRACTPKVKGKDGKPLENPEPGRDFDEVDWLVNFRDELNRRFCGGKEVINLSTVSAMMTPLTEAAEDLKKNTSRQPDSSASSEQKPTSEPAS